MWCGGSRSRAVGGSSGPRRRCGAASSVLALPKIEPARTRAQKRVRAARAAAKSAGAAADAASRGQPPERSAGGDGRARGPGFGPAPGAHLDKRQKIVRLVEAAPTTQGGGRGRELWNAERLSALPRSPGSWQAGHGVARRLGGPVLAACGAPLGTKGPKAGPARLQFGRPRRKAARSVHAATADLTRRVAHARDVFSGAQRGKGGS